MSLEHSPARTKLAKTIRQFCDDNQISRAQYYELQKQGLGPDEVRPSPKIIRITDEAERRWRRLYTRKSRKLTAIA